ncbi:5'-deoxynucleotidase HDDC2 [Atheta coriaria]|uniref:5'-deoxynucleotidase HDDC2 n=1 Tax=Dalotia coriaria TaxID=877792 RepID=UPI0031F3374A
MDDLDTKKTLNFINLLNTLKHSSRKGWDQMDVKNHEQISGHMYAMAMMTFLIGKNSGLDKNKCMQLALVHDLAECIVGDITPRDNVPEDIKHNQELQAMEDIAKLLGEEIGGEILALYKEYLAKETNEAKFVKDLDRFDMIYTALWYEKRDMAPESLQEFFDSTHGKFEHPFVRKLVAELLNQRQEFSGASTNGTSTCEQPQF